MYTNGVKPWVYGEQSKPKRRLLLFILSVNTGLQFRIWGGVKKKVPKAIKVKSLLKNTLMVKKVKVRQRWTARLLPRQQLIDGRMAANTAVQFLLEAIISVAAFGYVQTDFISPRLSFVEKFVLLRFHKLWDIIVKGCWQKSRRGSNPAFGT